MRTSSASNPSQPLQTHSLLPVTGNVEAQLNYISRHAAVTPRVVYSGGDAPQEYNEAYEFMPTEIHDGRLTERAFGIHDHGFQLVRAPTRNVDFDNDQTIEKIYYDEVVELVRDTTGANSVFVFDHTVRRGKVNSTRRPAHHVHNDYTSKTGLTRAREAIGEEAFSAMSGRRMIQVNVWRPLNDVVLRSPLALCDATSVDAGDLIRAEICFTGTSHVGEIFALHQAQGQRWTYFSGMTHDEAVLIKGFDTQLHDVARFTPHTAFEYSNQDPASPPRESIETRTFAFY